MKYDSCSTRVSTLDVEYTLKVSPCESIASNTPPNTVLSTVE